MVRCGTYMFEFGVGKGYEEMASLVKSMPRIKGGGSREGSDMFMSINSHQERIKHAFRPCLRPL